MTAQRVATIVSGVLLVALAGCTSFYEIAVETPIQPKLDVSGFQRVLVAGFIAGGTEDVDTNLETVRLLRSQLQSKSSLKVIDADVLPLMEIAIEQSKTPTETGGAADGQQEAPQQITKIKDEKDLQNFERIFANVNFWKRIGEEYQNPLIVTGTVLFTPHQRSGFVTREQEVWDTFGRRRTVPTRTYTERKGFILRPKFIFIDGRTGTTMYSESFREEILYSAQQNTPALSSYFELMDRLLPSFLSTLSTQKIRGTRVLLK
ncbi:MAG: hypothetical protein HYX76_02960 [Acidobacteria bacterium]|nr:hypothetical protein [Acidobacteriota bacterium]